MRITGWLYCLCLGYLYIEYVVSQPDIQDNGEQEQPANIDELLTDIKDDGGHEDPQNLNEFLPVPFDELMHTFASLLNAPTLKDALGKACDSLVPIIESLDDDDGDYNEEFNVDIPSSSSPYETAYTNDDIDAVQEINTICQRIQDSIDSETDVDLSEKICELLKLTEHNVFGDDDYHHDDDYYHPGMPTVYIRDGYRWLLNAFLMATLDEHWSSPWRPTSVSLRELLRSAFSMQWYRGEIQCDTFALTLEEQSGREFINQAFRNTFYEGVRHRFYPSLCEQHDEVHDESEEAFTNSVIQTVLTELLQLTPEQDICDILRSSFEAFDIDEPEELNGIINSALDSYHDIMLDTNRCFELFTMFSTRDPAFTQAIADYTGFDGIDDLCAHLNIMYLENTGVELTDTHDVVQHGITYDTIDEYYTSLMKLSSAIFHSDSALTGLSAMCNAPYVEAEYHICEAVRSAQDGHLDDLNIVCEKDLFYSHDDPPGEEDYHASQAFSIIFNSFFLFTFNGDWHMPYRFEFISITRLLRQSFDWWSNYDTMCQNIEDSLDNPGEQLISNAIKHTFRYFIRDHQYYFCDQEFELIHSDDGGDPNKETNEDPNTDPNEDPNIDPNTDPNIDPNTDDGVDLHEDGGGDPYIDSNIVLTDIMQFLLRSTNRDDMCVSLMSGDGTFESYDSYAEIATTSFLNVLSNEDECKQFLDIHDYQSNFLKALQRFTGYTTVEEFCAYVVGAYGTLNPVIEDYFFDDKYLHEPYMTIGSVFEGVHYKDLIDVSVNLNQATTVREGIRLLCEVFRENLDHYRSDVSICDAILTESLNFAEQCQTSNWFMEKVEPDLTDYSQYNWPWVEFERWLPVWFNDFVGYDHAFDNHDNNAIIIYASPLHLNLPHIVADALGFPTHDAHSTCDRMSDYVDSRDDTVGQIFENIIEYTLNQLAPVASELCHVFHHYDSVEAIERVEAIETPPHQMYYNQTYWQHLRIGPVEGPMAGKIFAYLTGYGELTEEMCRFMPSEESTYVESLKTTAFENILSLMHDRDGCIAFATFIDEERIELAMSPLVDITGFDSIDDMCDGIVTAFDGSALGELSFDWSAVTEHLMYYHPDEWIPSSPGEFLPGVTYLEAIQLFGNVYEKSLRSALQTTCDILNLESHGNDFPFENELCMFANNLDNYEIFRDFCYSAASDYETYFNNDHHQEEYEEHFPGYYFFLDQLLIEIKGHEDSESNPGDLKNDLSDELGVDISSTDSMCQSMETLYYDSTSVETAAHTFSRSLLNFAINHLSLFCHTDNTEAIQPDPAIPEGEVDFHMHLIELLVDVIDFLGDTDGPICEQSVESISLDTMEAKLFEVISNQQICTDMLSILKSKIFPEDIGDLFIPEDICNLIVTSFETISEGPIDISGITDDVTEDVPFHEALFTEKIMQLIAKIYQEPTISSAAHTICDILEQDDLIHDFEVDIVDMCRQVRDNNLDLNYYCWELIERYWFGIETNKNHYDGPYPDHHEDTYYSDEEEHWGDIPPEIEALYNFTRAKFGLDVSNPYSICEVGGNVVVMPLKDQLIPVVQEAMSLAINVFLRTRHDLFCVDMNTQETTQDEEDFPLELITDLIAYLADAEGIEVFCVDLLDLLQDDIDNSCVLEPRDDPVKVIATGMVQKVMMVIEDDTICNDLLAMVPDEFIYDPDLCTRVVKAFGVNQVQGYHPLIPADDILTQVEHFNETEAVLQFLTSQETLDFLGYLYNQPSIQTVLAVLCDNYLSLLTDLGLEEQEVLTEITRTCDVLMDDTDGEDIASHCFDLLVPLFYDSDYPVSLKQPNIEYEIAKIILPLAGQDISLDKLAIAAAIQTIINSDMTPRDFVNNLFDGVLPIGIQYALDVCGDWDAILEYLNEPGEDTPGHIQAIWKMVGIVSGYDTTDDTFYGFDCSRLRQDTEGGLTTVSDQLKERLWGFIETVGQCEELLITVSEFINDVSDDDDGYDDDENEDEDDGDTEIDPDYIATIVGYSSASELCQQLVDLVVAQDCSTFESCTEEIDPQCGSNGETYGNLCLLQAAAACNGIPDLKSLYAGECLPECPDTACIKVHDPHCGTDGKKYMNLCELMAAACKDTTLEVNPQFDDCEEEADCTTLVDCEGTCGGEAVEDCSGTCNGDATRDCNGECQGHAQINECGHCVGGGTGRVDDFGFDKCGTCKSRDDSYRPDIDCNADCGGEAVYDECGVCVGGNTGFSMDENLVRLDCLGRCDGLWREDTCLRCGPEYLGPFGSLFMDCAGVCHKPGSNKADMARLNECLECVGGNTGHDETYGINECGDCGSDTSSCNGCDGVPNSGKIYDACGICDGDGTSCVSVSSIWPEIAPSGEEHQFMIYGAGLNENPSGTKCVFVNGATRVESNGIADGPQTLTCQPVELEPGLYIATVEVSGSAVDSDDGEPVYLAIYQHDISLTVDPTEVNLPDVSDGFQVTIQADTAAFQDIKSLLDSGSTSAADMLDLDIRFSDGGKLLVERPPFMVADSYMAFNVPAVPRHSEEVEVFLKFGEFSLPAPSASSGLVLTFWAQSPQLVELVFDSTGALIASFYPGVDYKNLEACNKIFEDTSKLGIAASCRWTGPNKLKISMGTEGTEPLIEIGDTLVLKAGALTTFKESFSRAATGQLAVSILGDPVRPEPVIRGNRVISTCGTLILSARDSRGHGGRDMDYEWTVIGGPGDLTQVLDTSTDPRDIKIESQYLQTDTDYELLLKLSNFMGTEAEEAVIVRRSSEATPDVNIIGLTDLDNVPPSKSVQLIAEVTFTECFPPDGISYLWTVDDESVPMNLITRTAPLHTIDSHSLSDEETYTFTVKVYKTNDDGNFIEKQIMLTTGAYLDLIPNINKPSEFVIGIQGDDLIIEAGRSIDPDKVALEMNYLWQCLNVNENTACYVKDGGGETFPSEESINDEQITLDPTQMLPDTTYRILVEISKGNRFASTSVLIHTVDGRPPKVIIINTPKPINADFNYQLDAVIVSENNDVATIDWEVVNIDEEGYGYADLSTTIDQPNRSTAGVYTTTFPIEKDTLSPGYKYVFKLTACTVDKCADSQVKIDVLPTVTSCVLYMEGGSSYTELDKIVFNVDNCATATNAYPLTYQLYRLTNTAGTESEATTERKSTSVFEVIGKPAIGTTGQNTFIAKVCNDYLNCRQFQLTVDVIERPTLTPEQFTELKEEIVDSYILRQQFLAALVNYLTMTNNDNSDSRRRRRRKRAVLEESTPTTLEQLELAENVLASTVLDASSAELLINQLALIAIEELTFNDRGRLLDIVNDTVDAFGTGEDAGIPDNTITLILEITGTIAQDLIPQQLELIRSINSELLSSQVAALPLGGDPVQTSSDQVTSSVQKVIPTGVFHTKSSKGASVDFGAEIAASYGALWSCSSGSTCSGVVIHYEHYETNTDYLSESNEDVVNRAADVISISLHDPDSDAELNVAGLTTPITITMTISRPQSGKTYECRYWSPVQNAWLSDGITTVIITDTSVECLSTHLSYFTAIALDLPSTLQPTTIDSAHVTTPTDTTITPPPGVGPGRKNSGDLIIIIVSVLAGLVVITIILVIIAIICIKKSHNSTKVVPFEEEGGRQGFNKTDKPKSPPPAYSGPPPQQPAPTHGPIYPSLHDTAPSAHAPHSGQSNTPAVLPTGQPQQHQVHVVTVPVAMTQTTPGGAPAPPPVYGGIASSQMPLPPSSPVLYLPPSATGGGLTEIA